MYGRFEEWLDYTLSSELLEEIVAFCFNLYEEENNSWMVELVGTSCFEEDNPDWACEEVFDSREYPLRWQEECEWEDVHSQIETYIRQYLVTGRYAELLKGYQAVGMGFVDGDLSIIYKSEIIAPTMKCPNCGKDMQKGIIKTQAVGSLLNEAMISWFPDEDKGKWIQSNAVSLRLKGKGYYCDECMKVFAEFEEK